MKELIVINVEITTEVVGLTGNIVLVNEDN